MGLWDSFVDRFRTPGDLEDLLSESGHVLGKGAYGVTFKSDLGSEMEVAVKLLKDVTVSEEEFKLKMEEMGRWNHENLIPLRAFYFSDGIGSLLIYDYFPLGSFPDALRYRRHYNRPQAMNWEKRVKIALGAARGVQYIHSQGHKICHGNIKSSNILVSESYEARVSDFGLAKLANPLPTSAPSVDYYYHAPEVKGARNLSHKADVYSFGVFLLELLSGRVPLMKLSAYEEGVHLPRWVHEAAQRKWSYQVFDGPLFPCGGSTLYDMVSLLYLAVECTARNPDKRPSMARVTARIEQIGGAVVQHNQDLKREVPAMVQPQDLSLLLPGRAFKHFCDLLRKLQMARP